MKSVIFFNPYKEGIFEKLEKLVKILRDLKIQPFIPLDECLNVKNIPVCNDLKMADIYFTLGGDGTLLSIIQKDINFDIPIIPINMGFLGFLAYYDIENVKEILVKFLNHEFSLERRYILKVDLKRKNKIFKTFLALNDVVVSKNAMSKIISLSIFTGNCYINSYRSDGIIVATPTGSTAHSLSAGGPIVYPEEKVFIITPICPHTLSNRPLILPWNHKIKIKYLSDKPMCSAALTVDGQIGIELEKDDEICIYNSNMFLKIIAVDVDYFNILRKKLNWGI